MAGHTCTLAQQRQEELAEEEGGGGGGEGEGEVLQSGAVIVLFSRVRSLAPSPEEFDLKIIKSSSAPSWPRLLLCFVLKV